MQNNRFLLSELKKGAGGAITGSLSVSSSTLSREFFKIIPTAGANIIVNIDSAVGEKAEYYPKNLLKTINDPKRFELDKYENKQNDK